MAVRKTLLSLLTAPVAAAIDAAVREVTQEVLDARAPVRRTELAVMRDRLDMCARDLRSQQASLEGLRQAVDALHHGLDDDLDEFGLPSLSRTVEDTAATTSDLAKRVGRVAGALAEIHTRLDEVGPRVQRVVQRADQAHQLAQAADGLASST